MEYTSEIIINSPIENCIEKFRAADHVKHWQRGLISFEHISGEPGQFASKTKMLYKFGARKMELLETIVKNNLPHEFHATYHANGITNNQENYFDEFATGKTKWVCKNEFIPLNFTMRMMITFMPKGFKNQTMRYMKDFKNYVEHGKSILDR
ncbi:SRPBCC family protein [Aegicerativicinus sediminis]|uniref:SRPBCC family protein n=1 Tax=Aegicerativicinus sediminis TaxID=2893202 RepID=UPI001E335610|nr:SRPBCC family protein [Aegicerativicinus sediminis]